MAKRLTVEEAMQKVVDKINLLKDVDSVDVEKHMNKYAALRDLQGQERESAYYDIVFAIFGSRPPKTEAAPEESAVTLETEVTLATEVTEVTEVTLATEVTEVTDEALQLSAVIETEETTEFVLVDGPASEIATEAEAKEEPVQLPAVIETETYEIPEDSIETEVKVTGKQLRAQAIQETVDTVVKVGKAIIEVGKATVRVAKTVTETTPVAAGKVAVGAAWTWDMLVNLYYILSTYLPIGARWLAVHLVWAIQDALPVVKAGLQRATGAARVAGLGTARAASAVAGWVLVAVLAGISVGIKAARMAADGWRLREEILQEQAA